MNEALFFWSIRAFLVVVVLLSVFGMCMAWIPLLFKRREQLRIGLPCELPTGPPARVVKQVPLHKLKLLTAISPDGSNFSCGDLMHYNLENGRLWIMSTTWPQGRYVEGSFFSVTVVPR